MKRHRTLLCLAALAQVLAACRETLTQPDTAPLFKAEKGATVSGSFSTVAVLSNDFVAEGSPITASVEFGYGFSSISAVNFFFTFGDDPLDPGECLFFGPGFCNPGSAPQASRQLTIECAGDPGTCDSFRDGVDSRQISATRFSSSGAVSVRIATLVITVEGTRRLTSKDQCKNGQREVLGFANQGQCVRFVETGKASDQGNSPPTGIFTMVSAGGLLHTCGLTTAGATYCWGKNSNGAMGDGPFQRLIPEAVPGLPSFAAVSAAYSHTCGLTAGGTAYCWGDNFNGALGDGTTTSRSTPAFVAGGLSFAAVSAGSDLTCGVTVAGAAFCWGNNESGQLGDGTETDRAAPVLVAP